MPPPASTSNVEIIRRIDELRGDLREMRIELGKDYVRKELQDARDDRLRDQVTGLHDQIEQLDERVTQLTDQRDKERDARDAQQRSLRRLIYSVGASAVGGPVFILWLQHAIGLAPK